MNLIIQTENSEVVEVTKFKTKTSAILFFEHLVNTCKNEINFVYHYDYIEYVDMYDNPVRLTLWVDE